MFFHNEDDEFCPLSSLKRSGEKCFALGVKGVGFLQSVGMNTNMQFTNDYDLPRKKQKTNLTVYM